MNAYPPLPIREDWAPSWLRPRGTQNRDWAFRLVDAEGAYANDGTRRHSAVDWFAPGGTPVKAPRAGRVRRAYSTTDISGAVYGGILEIEEPGGLVWVMRHVDPAVAVGAVVSPGQVVARVSRWDGGAPHLHLEVWIRASGGYRHENMIDPSTVSWTAAPTAVPPPRAYSFEELPHNQGGLGPVVVGQEKGYHYRAQAEAVLAAHKLLGRPVSLLQDPARRWFVLWWKPGTHGDKFRFGPWEDKRARDLTLARRELATGRVMRPFDGDRSMYPWPRK